MKKTMLFVSLFIFTMASSVQALSWAYPFVVWDGNVYEVTDEKVHDHKKGRVIGEVQSRANDMTGDYDGDASNIYPKGTKYYEIKGISPQSAIAVEVVEIGSLKANYVHKAPFHWREAALKALLFLALATAAVRAVRWAAKRTMAVPRGRH